MKKAVFHYALPAFLVGAAALSAVSCADDELLPGGSSDKDAVVNFNVNDVQDNAINNAAPATRGLITPGFITPGIVNADLAGRKLEATNTAGVDACLIETTVEGVNPVIADARTRATIKNAIDDDFSSTGIRGEQAGSILSSPEWFRAERTNKDGKLYTAIPWSFLKPHARFFAVFPSKEKYPKLKINDMGTGDTAPTVDFEVEPNVQQQADFMTACTGYVHYATRGVHPTTTLDFRHTLTAIRFAVGQNLSWNKVINKVELDNVIMKSKYKLSNELSGTGAGWQYTNTDARGTARLDNVSVSTSRSPNVTIMGTGTDNFTFYMIPQKLDEAGKQVVARIHFTDGTKIEVPLKGEWKAGTTRTYKLSQKSSNWNYVLTQVPVSRPATYEETESQPYTITSYRENSGTRQAVPWKVIGYDADNDGKFSMSEKPDWLTSLDKTEGAGGTYAEACKAFLSKGEMIDLVKERNDGLKNATPLGTSAAPYDLSTQGGQASRSTANCYVISAPGFYRIPLVYGNAITKGNDNTRSYKTSNTGTYILSNFKDHLGNDIDNPWIEKTNGGANAGIDGARIVWADEANLVQLPTGSAAIVHEGGNAFLQFEVKKDDITSGNAVVAATKNGTVVWSWHLWFAPQSALTPIEVTNHQGVNYNFTTETVGWKPTKWERTTYDKARIVKVRIEQTIANNGTKQHTDVVITQNPGIKREGIMTYYQFGRKDAVPGTDAIKAGAFNKNGGNNMSIINGIQNPGTFYNKGSSWETTPPVGYSYYNLWSAGNTTTGYNDNPVIKTIYDPSPAGFKVPASNAFTGFTTTGKEERLDKTNTDGTTDSNEKFKSNFGYTFWTNSSKTATIFFPSSGYWLTIGNLLGLGTGGHYYSAIPYNSSNKCYMSFSWGGVSPLHWGNRAYGESVRPVTE